MSGMQQTDKAELFSEKVEDKKIVYDMTIEPHSDRNWLLRYCDHGRGERFGFHTEKDTLDWLPASVPGDVHLDMMAAGVITDPFYGTESNHCIWMEEKDWWYRTTFSLCDLQKIKQQQHVFLLFHGLDTFAAIYLNGEKLCSHRNMFMPLRIDITQKMMDGDNDLRVCLASPVFTPEIHRPSILARTPPQRLCSRKTQSCYGWDIAPRLVTTGIWRPMEIIVRDRVEVMDACVRTKELAGKTARVEFDFTIAAHDLKPHHILVELKVHDQSRLLTLILDADSTQRVESFELSNVPLWWPHNHGRPELLPYSITVLSNNEVMDRVDGKFGVRTIEMVGEPRGDGGKSFYFKVNGKPIFLKGMNWTPCDAIYARITDDKYQKLLAKTVESNINTLRVWGGGLYESGTFYDLCDQLGILVWQDFMFSCGVYPQDGEFLQEVREEAEYVVRTLRGHPSLFVWCGDNEVDWVYLQENIPDFWNNKINRQVLPEVCGQLDPDRPFIPSTPFSIDQDHPNDAASGDVHLWKHGSSYRDDYYAQSFPNMVTEIGHISLPDLEVMKTFIPEEKLWPPFNEHWFMHCADPNHCGDSYRVQSYFDSIKANGLPAPNNLLEMIQRMQQLQTEATTFWIQHFSSQPDCWGIFLWNLCDAWPQISDAYIAYPFHEKPALAAVREGFGKISR